MHRINKNIGTEDVKEVCEAGGVHVHEIEQVSQTEAHMKSFRVVIDFHHLDNVFTEDFWPVGVGCERYHSKRSGHARKVDSDIQQRSQLTSDEVE